MIDWPLVVIAVGLVLCTMILGCCIDAFVHGEDGEHDEHEEFPGC